MSHRIRFRIRMNPVLNQVPLRSLDGLFPTRSTSATAPCVALPRQLLPALLYLGNCSLHCSTSCLPQQSSCLPAVVLPPCSRPASLQSSCFPAAKDHSGCERSAYTVMLDPSRQLQTFDHGHGCRVQQRGHQQPHHDEPGPRPRQQCADLHFYFTDHALLDRPMPMLPGSSVAAALARRCFCLSPRVDDRV